MRGSHFYRPRRNENSKSLGSPTWLFVARVCRGIMEKGGKGVEKNGRGKIRVSLRKPSSADFSWQDKPRPVYSGLPWYTKMLVKPFSAGVSRERPQSRISPRGTSVCTGTLTRRTETLAYRRQGVCAENTLIDLSQPSFFIGYIKNIWTLKEKSY